MILGSRLGPAQLGALFSHFENKVMFQGFAWNINSFDQEGVQLGKVLANKMLPSCRAKRAGIRCSRPWPKPLVFWNEAALQRFQSDRLHRRGTGGTSTPAWRWSKPFAPRASVAKYSGSVPKRNWTGG
jgi:hypothetical protein